MSSVLITSSFLDHSLPLCLLYNFFIYLKSNNNSTLKMHSITQLHTWLTSYITTIYKKLLYCSFRLQLFSKYYERIIMKKNWRKLFVIQRLFAHVLDDFNEGTILHKIFYVLNVQFGSTLILNSFSTSQFVCQQCLL